MKNKIQYSSLLILIFTTPFLWSQQSKSSFLIADKNKVSTIYIDQNADQLVVWAVNELANDIQEITTQKPAIVKTQKLKGENGIYIGQINESVFKNYKKTNLKGAWEKFSIDQDKNNLYIVGSDVRGTVYGIFETAERLGISPWKWWADVNNIKKEKLLLNRPGRCRRS